MFLYAVLWAHSVSLQVRFPPTKHFILQFGIQCYLFAVERHAASTINQKESFLLLLEPSGTFVPAISSLSIGQCASHHRYLLSLSLLHFLHPFLNYMFLCTRVCVGDDDFIGFWVLVSFCL